MAFETNTGNSWAPRPLEVMAWPVWQARRVGVTVVSAGAKLAMAVGREAVVKPIGHILSTDPAHFASELHARKDALADARQAAEVHEAPDI